MAGTTGRHGRPDEPDDVDAVGDGLGVTPPTQALPTVRREVLTPETPAASHTQVRGGADSVRAVAKRVPSALPALGRDETSDAPSSARATADRRRRAREAAAGVPEAGHSELDSGSSAEGVDAPSGSAPFAEKAVRAAPSPGGPGSGAAMPPPPVPRQRVEPEAERVAVPAASGEVELVPIGTRAREKPPPPSAPMVASTVSPRIEDGRGGAEVVDAEIVDELPRPYGAPDAQTDEWVTVPRASAGQPAPGVPTPPASTPPGPPTPTPPGPPTPTPPALPAAAPARPAAPPLPARRSRLPVPAAGPREPDQGPPPGPPRQPPPGPAAAPDTWETTPLPQVTDDYRGRRRARHRIGRRPSVTGWLVVLGVVIVLSAAVAVPFIFTSNTPDVTTGASPPTGVRTTATAGGTSVPASGVPVIAAPSPTPSPSPTATADPSPTASTPGTQTSSAAPPPPPPFSTALEAESGSLGGCAQVRTVSGASVVDRLGGEDDWDNCRTDGVVRFNNVNLPAGTFTVTIHYVFGLNSGDQSRFARLRLDPTNSGNNIDHDHTYPRTTSIQSWTTGSFTVGAATTFTIEFTNPGAPGQDRAPALDRIVIQQQ